MKHRGKEMGARSEHMHACNPSIWRAEEEDYEFNASLGYITRLHKKEGSKEEREEGRERREGERGEGEYQSKLSGHG